MKILTVAYLRVSNEEQVANFSLDNQEEYCKRKSENLGYKLVKIYREEGKSATNTNRPELLKLLDYCTDNKSKIGTVLVYRYDRLSRDTLQALAIRHKLSELNIDVLSCTEPSGNDPMGNFMQTLSFALAQLDNDVKSQRTLDGMRKRFEAGLPHGKAPLGYLNSKNKLGRCIIIKDPEQFDFVKQSWNEISKGTHTLDTISSYMNKLGIRIKIGNKRKRVSTQHAHRIFLNKYYMGVLVSKRWGETRGVHEPMINEDLFYKVQAIIKGKSHKTSPHQRRNPDFPLRWFVSCGKCKSPLTAGWSTGRTKKYAYYYCNSGKHPCPSISKEVFESEFIEYLKSITPKKEFVKLFSAIIQEKFNSKINTFKIQQTVAEKELRKLENSRQKLIDGHIRGIYSDSIYKEQLLKIENELEVKKTVIAESRLEKLDISSFTNLMESFILNLHRAWLKGGLVQKQIIFGSIFPEKVYYVFPKFRTTRLAPFLEPFGGISSTTQLMGVSDGD